MPVLTADKISKKFRLYHQKTQSAVERFLMLKRSDYETLWALKDVSFSAEPGRILGLIGRNGSGKSTLLKVLARIYRADGGSFSHDGRLAGLLELGAGFHPELTGRENIFLNGSILGIPKDTIKSRFDEIVEFSGLQKFLETPIKTFSSGMVIRLGFSVAIISEPNILLVDEVLGVGDSAFAKKSIEKIKELRDKGVCIIFVSHDMPLIASLADETVWLENGVVEKIGDTRTIIREYLARLRTISSRDGQRAKSISVTSENVAIIDDIRVFDSSNKEAYLFKTGDEMIIAVSVDSGDRTSNANLRIAIQTPSGEECLGPIIKPLDTVTGKREYRFKFNSIPLNKGEYQINAALMDAEMVGVIDVKMGGIGFTIGGDAADTSGGLWHVDGEWL